MKHSRFLLLACAALLGLSSSIAQTPQPADELVKLIKEVQDQQAEISANQGKIESKLSSIGENLRVSRIFAGRSN